jgi:hypothetical protein
VLSAHLLLDCPRTPRPCPSHTPAHSTHHHSDTISSPPEASTGDCSRPARGPAGAHGPGTCVVPVSAGRAGAYLCCPRRPGASRDAPGGPVRRERTDWLPPEGPQHGPRSWSWRGTCMAARDVWYHVSVVPRGACACFEGPPGLPLAIC